MKPTRREFIVTTAVVAGAAAAWPVVATVPPEAAGEHVMLSGDPYLATVEDAALGGSFEAARRRALRFRAADSDRDRAVLGVEVLNAGS
jgi:hypothetical protein